MNIYLSNNSGLAPVYRKNHQEILKQHEKLKRKVDLYLIDECPDCAIVLNPDRQVIGYNKSFSELFSFYPEQDLLGLRPGELINCINSKGPNGCGSSPACRNCGAIQAIMSSSSGQTTVREKHLLTMKKGKISAQDLWVKAVPLPPMGEGFSLVFMKDIGPLNRKARLEQIFYHDAVNVLSGLLGLTSILREELPERFVEYIEDYHDRLTHLQHEIENHKKLGLAELGQLDRFVESVSIFPFLERTSKFFMGTRLAHDKTIKVWSEDVDPLATLKTDKGLLSRVVLNLLKNALEASSEGESIDVKVAPQQDGLKISIHNEKFIEQKHLCQIFLRSFSTKGPDRGLGTYSAKLLTENYLDGTLNVTSLPEEGTTFTILIPNLKSDSL